MQRLKPDEHGVWVSELQSLGDPGATGRPFWIAVFAADSAVSALYEPHDNTDLPLRELPPTFKQLAELAVVRGESMNGC